MSASQREIGNYIFEDLYKVSEEHQKDIAITFKGVGYSFFELEQSVNEFAKTLLEMGVKKDDHVGLLSINSYNWIVAFYAIIKVGAVAVLLNYMNRYQNLLEAVKNTDCSYLVYGSFLASTKDKDGFDNLIRDAGISKDKTISINPRDLDFKTILKNRDYVSYVPNAYDREEDSKRTSYIIFTTGTTSKPKAAMLSQYSMMNIIYHNFYKLDPVFPKKFMCLLPLFHCFGLLVVNAYMAFYRNVYINDLSDPINLYKEFLKHKCGDYASVAFIYDKLARTPLWWLHRGRFIKHCILGGGFTSDQEFEFLERKYGKGKFLNGYGQTECSPMISLVLPDSPKEKARRTVGLPMEDIEIKIMDTGTKEIVAGNNKSGEILIKGYNVFNGYYKGDKESNPFDKDGYLHTADLGYIDNDGYLVLERRIKDIIRRGENISPKEIEEAMSVFKEFTGVRVLGFPSIDDGEYILACVELKKKPPHFVEQKYFDELHKTLPSIKIPSHIIYMKRFPMNANGKLDEAKLREICIKKMSLFINKKLARDTASLIKKMGKENSKLN